MCTLMQKEALIELLSVTRSTLALRIDPQTPFSDDELRLGEIYNFLYSNSPEDIDFENLSKEILSFYNKYKDLPLFKKYL